MTKTLNVVNSETLKEKVSDVQIYGNPDLWKLICKASSKKENWMKSTKAMEIEGHGCIVQVTTQQGNNISEALVYVPKVEIRKNMNENYYYLL
ncbi:MAG: hypothetical protein ACW98D_16875 [Promethearchaeota archaeon]|jgi:hypothetical protein